MIDASKVKPGDWVRFRTDLPSGRQGRWVRVTGVERDDCSQTGILFSQTGILFAHSGDTTGDTWDAAWFDAHEPAQRHGGVVGSRPASPAGPAIKMSTRLDPELHAWLVDYCAANGCSKRDAIERGLRMVRAEESDR